MCAQHFNLTMMTSTSTYRQQKKSYKLKRQILQKKKTNKYLNKTVQNKMIKCHYAKVQFEKDVENEQDMISGARLLVGEG